MGSKVVVIGGTAAGLSAASKAKRADPSLDITVFEKSGYISYGACGLPYYVGGLIENADDLIALTPNILQNKRGIPTFTRHEVTRIDRAKKQVAVTNLQTGGSFHQPYDQLVIATGARPIIPHIPGKEARGVHLLRTVEDGISLRGSVRAGGRAVIIGGGFIGLETAEQLTQAGMRVELIEALPTLLPFLPSVYSEEVREVLEQGGVQLHLGEAVTEITTVNGAVSGVKTAGGKEIAGELVLLCIGVRPSSELAEDCGLTCGLKGGIVVDERQQTDDPSIWACGDCVQMRNLISGSPCYLPLGTTANKQGRVAGTNLSGGNDRFSGVLGSQVTKVFSLYVATTGLTEAQAIEAGFEPVSSSITKSDRASYYPGGSDNRLTLMLDRKSGRLLGAQGIGSASIAGRMNVLATAITCKMNVFMLNELDLVYSPSVAPVYDPILIAASQALKLVERKGCDEMEKTHEIIVEKDEDIKSAVEVFMLREGWENAYISGAIGSVRDVYFTTPTSVTLPPLVERTPCPGPGEILAFTGEVMKKERMDPALAAVYQEEGPLFIHIHASMAVTGGHVYGGGFYCGKAFRALKIYIQQVA